MPSSASGASPQQPLQSLQINNQNNNGVIGDGSNNFVNSGNIINSDIVIGVNDSEHELERRLDRFVSTDAFRNSFYSPPKCHPNTRTTVRNEIDEWLDESVSEKSPLLWLNGPAAVGKSVIAKTVSGFHNQIIATFFFSTSSDKSAATLFPTLAWQLAKRIPETREHIIASLKTSSQTSQIEEQFDRLIIKPLRKATLGFRPIMVIDGVDECTDENMLGRFLRILVQGGEAGDMPVRFIICSRPEPRIHAILGRVHNANSDTNEQQPPYVFLRMVLTFIPSFVNTIIVSNIAFVAGALVVLIALIRLILTALIRLIPSTALIASFLHRSQAYLYVLIQQIVNFVEAFPRRYGLATFFVDTDASSSAISIELVVTLDKICPHPVVSTIQIGFSEECKNDIANYLTDRFNAICHPTHPGEGTSPWFQQSDISDLVEASCGQFLYASTIVRLLDESCFDPRDVLKMARRSSLPTPDLNKLYMAILKRAQDTVRNQAKEGGPDYESEWRFVMDPLAILVFFARNDHFFTVRKSLPIIETLLGLENGKLALKLRKMHSVLRIVPEKSIQVYHRSFLEFLQNRNRAEEYYISFSNGLWRSLILMIRAGLRYNQMILYALAIDGNTNRLAHVNIPARNFLWRTTTPAAFYT